MREVKSYVYESGSSAHKLYTLHEYEEQQEIKRRKVEKQKREISHANARMLRHNRIRSIQLVLGIILFGAYFCGFVYLQNGITTGMKNIRTIQGQISDLKAENGATESRIAAQTSLSNIKKTATKKLGMVYASKGQIVYYNMEDEDYMIVSGE